MPRAKACIRAAAHTAHTLPGCTQVSPTAAGTASISETIKTMSKSVMLFMISGNSQRKARQADCHNASSHLLVQDCRLPTVLLLLASSPCQHPPVTSQRKRTAAQQVRVTTSRLQLNSPATNGRSELQKRPSRPDCPSHKFRQQQVHRARLISDRLPSPLNMPRIGLAGEQLTPMAPAMCIHY